MTYIPGINQPIPGSPFYPEVTSTNLDASQYPMVYTTDGPLPTSNGIAFTATGITFDPTQVSDGIVTKIVAGDNITVSGDGTGEVTISSAGGGGYEPTTGTVTGPSEGSNSVVMATIPFSTGTTATQVYIVTAYEAGQNYYSWIVSLGYTNAGGPPVGSNLITPQLAYAAPGANGSFSVQVQPSSSLRIRGSATGGTFTWVCQRIA
jgi:hypothetical protein